MLRKFTNFGVLVAFLTINILPVSNVKANTMINLPEPGTMLFASRAFTPVMINGLRVHPDNPLLFDFILDTGNSGMLVDSPKFKDESSKLINYFLAALTVKDTDQWVNLSPYEKDKITSKDLGSTGLGRDMLAQDYILKQITASMIYPEKELGRKFWNRLYEQVQQRFGNQEIPVNALNKVWIVADKAKVLVRNNTAYVIDGHLKVMLEEDYLALTKNNYNKSTLVTNSVSQHIRANEVSQQTKKIVQEIVIPHIEQEVNKGAHFAPLRQIFYSMILATWYKKTLKQALLNQVYSNQAKTAGSLSNDPTINEKIYEQYLQAYKKGVFNYIKEDLVKAGQQPLVRKYFSGGVAKNLGLDNAMQVVSEVLPAQSKGLAPIGNLALATVRVDRAMTSLTKRSEIEKQRLNEILINPKMYPDNKVAVAVQEWAQFPYALLAHEQKERTNLLIKIISDSSYGSTARIEALEGVRLEGFSNKEFTNGKRQEVWNQIQLAIKKALQSADLKVKDAAEKAKSRLEGLRNETGLNSSVLYQDLTTASSFDRAMGSLRLFKIPIRHEISISHDILGGPTIAHFAFDENSEFDKFLAEVGLSKDQINIITSSRNNPAFEAALWTKLGPNYNPYLVFGIKGENGKEFFVELVTDPKHDDYFQLENVSHHKRIQVSNVQLQYGYLNISVLLSTGNKPLLKSRTVKFGTSGDRGIIDWDNDGRGDFSLPLVQRISQGIADYLKQTNEQQQAAGGVVNKKVLIGYDTRHRNPEFSKETARILAANGLEVLYVATEATPTPVLAILAQEKQVAGVVNFTASHSPYTDGGVKFSPGHGGAADGKITSEIEKLANKAINYSFVDYEQAINDKRIIEIDPEVAVQGYVNGYLIPTLKNLKDAKGISAWEDLVNYVINNPQFNLVVDPMQGAGVRTVQLLYGEIAKEAKRSFFRVIHVNNKDSKFSETGGAPQPSGKYIKPLLEIVAQNQTTVGVAQDGDVDRFGIVDFGGKQVEANDMIPLLTWFLNKEMGLNGAVVKTVATSNFANAVANHLGLELIETPVGFKYAVEQVLNKVNVVVMGEESAHVGVGPLMKSWDDGFAVGLMALWIVAKTGKSLNQYKQDIEKEIGKTFILRVHTQRDEQSLAKNKVITLIQDVKRELASGQQPNQIKLADEIKKLLPNEEVVSVNTMDGVKLVLKSGDWILMRPSGTEPAAKLYVEVTKPARLEQVFQVGLELMGVGSTDKALITQQPSIVDEEFTRGGIDLNVNNMSFDVDFSGNAIEFKFDPAMVAEFKKGNFKGVEGIILRIVPIASPLPLLGLSVDASVKLLS